MNNFTNLKSLNYLFTAFTFIALSFLASCGGDDEASPDCSSLELTATVEGTTITASADGGNAPYQFSLNGGTTQSNSTFANLEPGTYAIAVTDANECTDSQNLQVIDPCANFSISATASAYEITIALTSGEAPFDYEISYGGETLTGSSDVRSFTLEVEEAADTEITISDASECVVEASLTAEEVRTFTDSRDGQEYLTIKIGEQIWFAENFNYNTNTADSTSSWYYDDDSVANAAEYGKLYSWYVAQEIAPEGWVLPSEADIDELNIFLGINAGTKIKVGGGSEFEAKLAGVWVANSNSFFDLNEFGDFWTKSEQDNFEAKVFGISEVSSQIREGSSNKENGLSVRFIKN